MKCLTHFINEKTPGYGGSKEDVQISSLSCMGHGDSCNSLKIIIKNHVGTHIDLPKHFDPNGKALKDYKDDFWRFHSVQLINHPCEPGTLITVDDLLGKVNQNTDCLLLKTSFENFRDNDVYWAKNPGIHKEVGPWLRQNFPSLRVIGFDFISLTSFVHREHGREAHKGFLGPLDTKEPIIILEDLKLSVINESPKSLIIAPLWIDQADGCPATVFSF